MSKRTRLIQKTKLVVKKLNNQQTRANQHQANLYQWFNDHQYILGVLLIPVIIFNVKKRDKIQIKLLMRKAHSLLVVTSVALLKKTITQILNNKR